VGGPNRQKTLQDTVKMGTIEGAPNLIVLGNTVSKRKRKQLILFWKKKAGQTGL